VIVDDEDFEKAAPGATQSIDIVQFVARVVLRTREHSRSDEIAPRDAAFEPSQFHDTYREKLQAILARSSTNGVDLVSVLERSLAAQRRAKSEHRERERPHAKKRAHGARGRRTAA
jgi:non-homologous end joining protein Ku